MRSPAPWILFLSTLLVVPAAWADEGESDAPEEPPYNPIPEPIRDDMKPLGFGLGFGSLGFSFLGAPVHIVHSIRTVDAATRISVAGPELILLRTGRIHRVSAALAIVRSVPIAASIIGLGAAQDDAEILHALGLPYLVLGAYDLVSAGVSGINAIRLLEDRDADSRGWTPEANDVADASIEAGGAWAGGMVAVGTIELIVGGLALHGAHRMEASDGRVSVRLLPAPGGALLVGRF